MKVKVPNPCTSKWQNVIDRIIRVRAEGASNVAFEEAIILGMDNPEDYMHMYSTEVAHHFKHRDTREYAVFDKYDFDVDHTVTKK